jgi:ABC-2 type transport system permease protein
MTAAVRAELRKLLTTRVWLGMTGLALGLGLAFTILATATSRAEDGGQPLQVMLAFDVGFANVSAAVLGIVTITGEYRHLTATPTFLSVPRRGRVVAAKLLVHLVAGLLLGALSIGAAVAVAAPWLAAKGFPVDLGSAATRRIMVGGTVVVALYGILGLGLGALVRNQVAAVVGILLWLFAVEPVLQVIPTVQSAYPYLPGGGAQALLESTDPEFRSSLGLLEPWQGGLLLAAYGLVLTILGTMLTTRRDVT